MESISGTLTFKAYGVEALSDVYLGQNFSSVPESVDFAVVTAAVAARWRRSGWPALFGSAGFSVCEDR